MPLNQSNQPPGSQGLGHFLAPAGFADIDVRSELRSRLPRPRSHYNERRAYAVLATQLRACPADIFRRLAELAIELCAAQSAGITIHDGDSVRWAASVGALGQCRTLTSVIPNPFVVCVEQNATQLLRLPDRHFPSLSVEPRIVEILIVPFLVQEQTSGTISIATHADESRFDRDDERILRTLSDFASSAWQLVKARDSAEASKRKDEFLALLGHELRNPLAAVVAALSVVQQELPQSPRVKRALDVLARQSGHMKRLAEDLLDAGRIASGKLQIQSKRLNLLQVVTDALAICRARLESHSLSLTVDFPQSPIWIDGDIVRLTQAICNLIDNASKYTPTDGQVSVSCAVTGSEARIVISDNGRGMRPDQLQSIFQPFVQLPDAESDREGGLGLGLPLVRSVIELHGGRVDARSDGPGCGSCFTIRLPRASAGADAIEADCGVATSGTA